jgi:ATP-dependent helicase Lhr and Lhr-like helicase
LRLGAFVISVISVAKTFSAAAFTLAIPDEAAIEKLHPPIPAWFKKKFSRLTSAQSLCLPAILRQESVLLSSPTGSGKTLAAFLGVMDYIIRVKSSPKPPLKNDGAERRPDLSRSIQAVYISPLRALAYDIQKNLAEPINEMNLSITVALRTGDTSQTDRRKIKQAPPDILVTTPESLAILLSQASYADSFRDCRFVIIDEIHSIAENKRGVDLSISMERLQALCPRLLCRIGLSATVAPLDEVASYLVGVDRWCVIAAAEVERKQIVEVFSPIRQQPYPPAGYAGTRVLEEVSKVVAMHQSVLIFCNTRSGAENVGFRLKQALPDLMDQIETHHSSLDRSVRLDVEDRLKRGELRAVVCSTSLEMGIDIGAIDLVIMVATPKGISRTLQRIGRSGHSIHQTSHGILVATNINDLVECTVTAALARERRLDPVVILKKCYDVIAQHVVGMAASGPIRKERALEVIRRAWAFKDLSRAEFDRILLYLEGGGKALGKQYQDQFGKIIIEEDVIRIASRKAQREFLLNVGTIPSEMAVTVFLGRRKLGQVEQGFIKRLNIGDRFVLAGQMVELVETGVLHAKVKRGTGPGPIVPSWNANKMPLTSGLAREVVHLRTEVNRRLDAQDTQLTDWLVETYEVSTANAQAMVKHFVTQRKVSRIPIDGLFLIEVYFEELYYYFFHALIGRSGNDALSRIVSYRIKNLAGGNAMATIDDYGFLLTLRPFQRMSLEQLRELFARDQAEADLDSALRDSELVRWQFRGVAQTGLMVPRNRPEGVRRPKQVQWNADILFRVLEAHEPDHPLLLEAYKQAEQTFLDSERAFEFMSKVEHDEWALSPVKFVSPFAFGMYASGIKEAMLHEDPEATIERLFHEAYGQFGV